MGLGLCFAEGEGPKFERVLQRQADIAKLEVPDMVKLRYVFDAVASIRSALDGRVPLIGFSGSPFTLACYMVEGGSSKEFRTIKSMMYARPDLLHKILDVNAQAVTAYLNAQIDAGAQAVQIFDTWGGVLSDAAFAEFSLHYMQQIISGLKRENEGRPCAGDCVHQRRRLVVGANGRHRRRLRSASIGRATSARRAAAWAIEVGAARQFSTRLRCSGTPESIRAETARILAAYGEGSGHVFNLGHGINQHANPEHAKILVDAVHELSRPLSPLNTDIHL